MILRSFLVGLLLLPGPLAGQSAARKLLSGTWTRLWTLGGHEADTLLKSPGRLIVSDGLVYVLDHGEPGILAIRLETGRVVWSYAKPGQGPGELTAPQSLAHWPGGGAVVGDAATRRLTVISPAGRFLETITPRVSVLPHGVCILSDRSILIHGPLPEGALVRVSPRGEPLLYPSFPDPALREASLQDRFGMLSAGGGRCFLALQSFGRMYELGERGVISQWRSVEPFEPGDSAKTVAGRDPRLGPPTAALSVAAEADTVSVAFEGISEVSGRVIDLYAPGGRYLGSVLAPRPPVNRIVYLARSGGIWVMIHGINELPAISAFRFTPRSPGR